MQPLQTDLRPHQPSPFNQHSQITWLFAVESKSHISFYLPPFSHRETPFGFPPSLRTHIAPVPSNHTLSSALSHHLPPLKTLQTRITAITSHRIEPSNPSSPQSLSVQEVIGHPSSFITVKTSRIFPSRSINARHTCTPRPTTLLSLPPAL